jgi:hypothetical protein
MSFFSWYFRALAVCLGAVLWTGCAAQQMSAPTVLLPAAHSGHPWMASNANSQDLLYLTEACGGICVFTYPGGTLVHQLSDSNNPFGECVDKTGDVFVAEFGGNTGTAAILEYAHGGTSPIATLSDPGYHPESCSIDPTTGNLAVTNDDGPVGIYTGAKGDPAYYADPKASLTGFCAYDDKGNLFVDGEDTGSNNYALVEMPRGSYRFKSIKLNSAPSFPYDIQWAGKYLAVADGPTVIYHLAINGTKGTVIGSTVLNGPVAGTEVQFWIQGGTIIQPYGTSDFLNQTGFWRWPTGGKLRRKIDVSKYGSADIFGAVVSPATTR